MTNLLKPSWEITEDEYIERRAEQQRLPPQRAKELWTDRGKGDPIVVYEAFEGLPAWGVGLGCGCAFVVGIVDVLDYSFAGV